MADVTKQLEKQAIEDKEKEEDGEEGDCLPPENTHHLHVDTVSTHQMSDVTNACLCSHRWR